uniref:Uncharacterized protein n=1 Tax=Oryza rufipogon TaxID=4529 RepID=A0A0E0P622_ORYRU
MAEAIILALSKINSPFGLDPTNIAKSAVSKLYQKGKSLAELPGKVEEIRMELTTMENVIEQLDTAHLTDKVIKGWIAEVRKLAYHVEDVMDKYSYHALQMEEEGFLKKYVVKGSHYAIVFDGIVAEIVQIEQEIQRVIKLKDKWLQPSQLIRNKHSDFERKRSQGCLPELVKDEDLVGIEGNRMLLTGWLYSNELDSTVITVSGMGGLGKTTIVANVYERGKIRFHAHAWIVVSQTYDVEELLRKVLRKIGYADQAHLDGMDVHDLKEKFKENISDRRCLIVLDDVWDREAYNQIHDAFQNLQASRIIITTRRDLSNCFLYCSMFPEDCPMPRDNLVRLWVAEGFAARKENNTPEDVAEGNLNELINRNMLEVVETDELGRVSTCKMHDIMRDLALFVAKDERFGSANDSGTMMLMDNEVRRLSMCRWEDKGVYKAKFPRLRTLISVQTISSSSNMLSSIFSESTYLTVLELQDSEITEVPTILFSTLSNMPLLSTLLLSASSKTETLCFKTLEPISGRLHKLIVRGHWANGTLQCPIFQDCGRNLKYLALSWCHLGEDPLSLLASHVPYLTFLRLNRVYTTKTLVLSAGCFPELKTLVLKHMPDVNKVEIEDRALPRIEGLHIVSLYNVKKVPEGIEFLRSLKKLWLLHLHKDFNTYWESNGMHEKMAHANTAKTLILSAGCFPVLKTLVLMHMSDVNKVEVEAEALPHIEGLHIVKKVSEGIEFLRSLKKLWLLNLHKDFNTYSKRNGMHEKMVCGQEGEADRLMHGRGESVEVCFQGRRVRAASDRRLDALSIDLEVGFPGQRHWDLGFEERSPKAYQGDYINCICCQDTLCLALARDNPSRGTDYTTGNLVHGALTSLRLFTKQHRQPLLKVIDVSLSYDVSR